MMFNNLLAKNIWDMFTAAFIEEQRYLLYLKGLGNTVMIALGAAVIGIILGVLVALVNYIHKKTGKLNILHQIFKVYITVVRGTPTVLQLFIMYFVVFASLDNGVIVGIVTFGINSGAYVAEIVRAGYESVDDGQMEAGRSLGLSVGKTVGYIITPQAIKNVTPPLFNELITLIKETSIVGYVGIMDLGKVPGLIYSRTFDFLFPLLISAAIYLVIVMIMTKFMHMIEKKLAVSERH